MTTTILIVSDLVKNPKVCPSTYTYNAQTYFRDGVMSASLLGNKEISLLTCLYNFSDLQNKLFYLLHQSNIFQSEWPEMESFLIGGNWRFSEGFLY